MVHCRYSTDIFWTIKSKVPYSPDVFSQTAPPLVASNLYLKMVCATQHRIFALLQHCHCLELFVIMNFCPPRGLWLLEKTRIIFCLPYSKCLPCDLPSLIHSHIQSINILCHVDLLTPNTLYYWVLNLMGLRVL